MEPEVIKTLFIVALLAIIGLGNYLFFRVGMKVSDNRLRETYDEEYRRGYGDGLNDAVRMIDLFVKDNEENETDQDK
jgi:hypothetical protein